MTVEKKVSNGFSRRDFVRMTVHITAVAYGHFALTSCAPIQTLKSERDNMNPDSNERFERGLKKLKEIDGKAGERVIESLKNVAPDLGRYTIEFPFVDVYSRPGLDLKSRGNRNRSCPCRTRERSTTIEGSYGCSHELM